MVKFFLVYSPMLLLHLLALVTFYIRPLLILCIYHREWGSEMYHIIPLLQASYYGIWKKFHLV